MLNGTLCATERAMCCIVETYQEEKGLRIPRALQPSSSSRISCVEFIYTRDQLLRRVVLINSNKVMSNSAVATLRSKCRLLQHVVRSGQ